MSVNLYLFMPKAGVDDYENQTLSWVYKDVNNEIIIAQGSFSDVANSSRDYNVIVVLPGEDVLFLSAKIPGKNMQKVRQALPYVLEDSLIDDVDELHFSINKTEENNYQVAVINKAYFIALNKLLSQFKIHAECITADYLLLKDSDNAFVDGERIIYSGKELKLATSITNNDLIELLQPVKIIQCGKDEVNLFNDTDIKRETCIANPLICFVKNSYVPHSINLLQGEFKITKKWSEQGKKWLPAAVACLVLIFVQMGLFVVDYVSISQKNAALNTQINKIYKRSFPQAKRIVNAKVQMQQKLSELRKRKGQAGSGFTQMIVGSAGILSKTKGFKIKSLRYFSGKINLELDVASLQELEQLKEKLSGEGYQVDIKNAASAKDVVTAQLQIAGASL